MKKYVSNVEQYINEMKLNEISAKTSFSAINATITKYYEAGIKNKTPQHIRLMKLYLGNLGIKSMFGIKLDDLIETLEMNSKDGFLMFTLYPKKEVSDNEVCIIEDGKEANYSKMIVDRFVIIVNSNLNENDNGVFISVTCGCSGKDISFNGAGFRIDLMINEDGSIRDLRMANVFSPFAVKKSKSFIEMDLHTFQGICKIIKSILNVKDGDSTTNVKLKPEVVDGVEKVWDGFQSGEVEKFRIKQFATFQKTFISKIYKPSREMFQDRKKAKSENL